jgi:ribose-phosphate pyrophosphokinase
LISVNGIQIKPTLFPDGTSQCWGLPQDLIEAELWEIDWRFEDERELFWLFSLRQLNQAAKLHLYVPFLPYARQDKEIANDATFNLKTFALLLNRLRADIVESLDVHNPRVCYQTISNFQNIKVDHMIRRLIDDVKAGVLVYPDSGAASRYPTIEFPNVIVCEKDRDPLTGSIDGHRVTRTMGDTERENEKFLIIDDICDGGATFHSVARLLRARNGDRSSMNLYVTHGIFSKGRESMLSTPICNAFDNLYCTDSLPRNKGHKGVIPV